MTSCAASFALPPTLQPSTEFTAASADSDHRNKFDFSRKITIFVHLIEKSEAAIFNDAVFFENTII